MKVKISIFILLLFAYLGYTAGTNIGTGLNLPVSARIAALSTTYGAISSDDVTAFSGNPAKITGITTWQVGGIYTRWIAEMNYTGIYSAVPLNLFYRFVPGILGVHILNLDQGRITETDINGIPSGRNLTAGEFTAGVTYAHGLWNNTLKLGTNVKFITLTLGDSKANNVIFDAGVSIPINKFLPLNKINEFEIGLSIQNIAFLPVTYLTIKEPVIPRVNVSIGGRWDDNLYCGTDINFSPGSVFKVSLGVEYWLFNLMDFPLSLRGGYTYTENNKYTKNLGFTFGIGVMVKQVRLDYAYLPTGLLGDTHYVSLTYDLPVAK